MRRRWRRRAIWVPILMRIILGITFKLVNSADYYEYDEDYEVWTDKSDNKKYMKKLVVDGEDITVVGIVQPSEDANGLLLKRRYRLPRRL